MQPNGCMSRVTTLLTIRCQQPAITLQSRRNAGWFPHRIRITTQTTQQGARHDVSNRYCHPGTRDRLVRHSVPRFRPRDPLLRNRAANHVAARNHRRRADGDLRSRRVEHGRQHRVRSAADEAERERRARLPERRRIGRRGTRTREARGRRRAGLGRRAAEQLRLRRLPDRHGRQPRRPARAEMPLSAALSGPARRYHREVPVARGIEVLS
ncbi:hypothetical protein F01_350033 [Burkholderia cenocepacia]|nr:hypothetical protein F01_350033 [Burkholderia cenocepacia]